MSEMNDIIKNGQLMPADLTAQIRDKYYHVDVDPFTKSKRLFFDNSGGSFRLKDASEAFRNVDDLPNCGGHGGAASDYLDSLRLARKYPVRLALPGHRKTGDYAARIEALLAHHERRLAETEALLAEHPGMTAYETAGKMRWKIRAASWEEFPPSQKWFAVGECMAHLDYLRLRGRIRREMDGEVWRWFTVTAKYC